MPILTRLPACFGIAHLLACIAMAQPTALDSIAQRPHHVAIADYPVPLPAALLSLGARSMLDALELSTVRTVTVGARAISDSNGSRIGLGVEIAPILLTDDVTLGDYLSGRLFRLLIRPRVSFAFAMSGGGFDASVGLRWMLHDDADLRADSTLLTVVARASAPRRAQVLDSARSALADRMWNLSVFELAVTSTMRTEPAADESSLIVEGYQGYFSIAEPIAGHRAQVMLGLSGGLDREGAGDSRTHGAVALRGIYGSRSERLFLGARYVWPPESSSGLVVDAGGILRVAGGLWLRPGIVIPVGAGSALGARGMLEICVGAPSADP